MNYTTRLLIPIALGAAAALFNWMAARSGTQPVKFIQVSRELSVESDEFSMENLEAVEIPAKFSKMEESCVPFREIGLLLKRPVPRNYLPGDLVLWRDIELSGPALDLREGETAHVISLRDLDVDAGLLQVGRLVRFRFQAGVSLNSNPDDPYVASAEPEWVGPFRLVSVGNLLTPSLDSKHRVRNPDSVSVAIHRGQSPQQDKAIDQLVNFCDRQSSGQARLLGLELLPAKDG